MADLDTTVFAASQSFYQAVGKIEGNVVSSPVSCLFALGMLFAGSETHTRKSMAKALQFPENLTKTAAKFEAVSFALQGLNGVELSIANKAFAAEDISISLDYVTLISKSFLASAENADFKHPEVARAKINDWVNAETKGLIKKLLDEPLEINTRLVLLNAIYFKGQWESQFNPENTKMTQYFWGYREIYMKVPMMHKKDYYLHAVLPDLDAQAIAIPYKGGDMNLLVILPNKNDGLYKLTEQIDQLYDLKSIMSKMTTAVVDVFLPKFKIESTIKLEPYLREMGLADIFEVPDFSGISAEKLIVSKVIQKAVIEVNEEGTVAAASTAAVAINRMTSKRVFRCDHPFFFFLTYRDNFSLFGGKFDRPE
ncbi:serpin B4-like [Cloeon dipterum]|uniref:serpin B4-like n=1 Tax=Cloeon dipterum TaxID=197152 RepID=UPI0032202D15